jgi:hypothetical protein
MRPISLNAAAVALGLASLYGLAVAGAPAAAAAPAAPARASAPAAALQPSHPAAEASRSGSARAEATPAAGRSAPLALPGGLRAVAVPGSRTAVNSPKLPPLWTYKGTWVVKNVANRYVITLQTNNSSGRLANHLYMWAYHGGLTQKWRLYEYYTLDDYLFESAYNGLCISIPGASGHSGVQLIVHSCAASPGPHPGPGHEPKYEVFSSYRGDCRGAVFLPSYDYDLAIGIVSLSPGARVLTVARNYSNCKENWNNG